ncbi:Hypothetical predicted protein [Pelobates cultripes]|uniref:Uncharacterized protein n=1 Tax=Pelobates cultripes TaxID=61616 RepID=A0AAD1WI43_PELCU|nr:Hypothetical predicted protein [Pelobates cultripes]
MMLRAACVSLIFPAFQIQPVRLYDLAIKTWAEKGVHTVQDLMEGDKVKTFPVVRLQFSLASRDLFLNLRVKNILTTRLTHTQTKPQMELLPLAQVLSPKKTKPLSLCYNALLWGPGQTKLSYMTQWETELGEAFLIEQWHKAMAITKKASRSLLL